MFVKTLLLLVATLKVVDSFNIKCNATKQHVTFTVSDVTKNATGLNFNFKLPGKVSWSSPAAEACTQPEELVLVCRTQDFGKSQNFRIDLTVDMMKENMTEEYYQEVWYYDCFDKHGVNTINRAGVAWNEFTVAWNHYKHDELFIKEDEITVTDEEVGKVIHQADHDQKNKQTFTFNKVTSNSNYTVCVKTKFFKFGTGSKETPEKCLHILTTSKPRTKSAYLKTTLLAVGIGVLCLVLLCLLFVIYNKKCKQGGDHDYDMNKDVSLMGGEAANEGEELQMYKDGNEKDKMISNGAGDKEEA